MTDFKQLGGSIAAIMLPFLCASAASMAETPGKSFAEPTQLETGVNPTAAAIAEVTGDGHADLLIVNHGSNDLWVWRGDGAGGLGQVSVYPAGPNPDSLAVGDFNADGRPDVAVANHETPNITLLINQGDGVLAPHARSPLTVSVRPHVHQVQTLDMDGDGHLDLLVDNREGEGFVLLRGRGDATFELPGESIDAGGDPYLGMAMADLNQDQRPDIVAPLNRSVTVMLSNPKGFAAPRHLQIGGAFGVALADFDGDGSQDLLSAPERGPILVAKGLGGANFEIVRRLDTENGAKRVASGDFNGDGRADFVIQNYLASPMLVLLGTRDGGEAIKMPGGKHPWGLAIADLNNDGHDDLVSLDFGSNVALVFLSLSHD